VPPARYRAGVERGLRAEMPDGVEVLEDRRRRRAVASPRAQDRLAAAADARLTGAPVAYYREWLAHPTADDPYWRATDHCGALGRTAAAVHLVSGWYDLRCRELLADYAALTAAGRAPYLTIGPWHHSQVGMLAASLREGLAWFDANLKQTFPTASPQSLGSCVTRALHSCAGYSIGGHAAARASQPARDGATRPAVLTSPAVASARGTPRRGS